MINHSVQFVDPNNRSIHTQNIESLWRAAKQKFKAMNGVDRKYLTSHITDFVWRYNNSQNRMEVFEKLIDLIPKHYNKVIKLRFISKSIIINR